MNDVIPFDFDGSPVRAVVRGGDPWFVAADVCRALGIGNVSMAVEKLDGDERDAVSSTDTIGRRQEVTIISESGLYTLVLRSRDATTPGSVAHRFRKWVTAEVLPTLRRTGRYEAAPPLPQVSIGTRVHIAEIIDLRDALSLVREARHVMGRGVALAIWRAVGLPTPVAIDAPTPIHRARVYAAMRDAGAGTDEIAAAHGVTRRHVQKYLRLLTGLVPEALDAIEAGTLTYTQADALAQGAPDEQRSILAEIVGGEALTERQILSVLRMMRADPAAA
jgi:prophage antirepressor-like protein